MVDSRYILLFIVMALYFSPGLLKLFTNWGKLDVLLKVLKKYLRLSLYVIIGFGVIYFSTFLIGIQVFGELHLNGAGNLPKDQVLQNMNSVLLIKNMDIIAYLHNKWLLLLDSLYFSTMTFFTVGYGDITVTGICRVFPIIECITGTVINGIYISSIFIKITKSSNTVERIKLKLYRGWEVGSIKKSDKSFYQVLLINEKNEHTIEIGKLDDEYCEFLEDIKINWEFNTVEKKEINSYLKKFAIYLNFEFLDIYVPTKNNSMNVFKEDGIDTTMLKAYMEEVIEYNYEQKEEKKRLDYKLIHNMRKAIEFINGTNVKKRRVVGERYNQT